MRPNTKISIGRLLIVINCLIMSALFFISYYFSNQSYKEIMEKELKDKQYQMLVYVSDNLNVRMNSIELLARSTANNYSIINNVLKYRENDNAYEQSVFQNNMNKTLSTIAYSMSDIVSVNILLEDEHLRTTKTNGVYNYDFFPEEGEAIRQMSSGWLSTRRNQLKIEAYADYISTFVIKMYAGLYSGEVIGHLVINVDEELFYRQIAEYHQDEDSILLFVDKYGKIISSTDRNVIGKTIEETEYMKYAGILSGEMEPDRDSRSMIYNKKNLDDRDSYVMAIADYNKTIASFREMQRNVLLFSILLLLVFVAFTAWLSYTIAKPLLMLSKEVRDFKNNRKICKIQNNSNIFEIDVLCSGFEDMTIQINELIRSLLQQEKQKQKQELEILQAQINPHFLYNTLDSINWMALSRKQKEISNMVIMLGTFLRLSLNKGNNLYLVRDELNHLKCYIEIQNIRTRGKIDFSLEVEPEILDYQMVKLLLQPLVENSIIHGFDFRGGAGQIRIRGYKNEQFIYFVIRDDGCGMPTDLVNEINDMTIESGHGIRNVMKRIQLYYGNECGLSVESSPESGTTIEIRILNKVTNHQEEL